MNQKQATLRSIFPKEKRPITSLLSLLGATKEDLGEVECSLSSIDLRSLD